MTRVRIDLNISLDGFASTTDAVPRAPDGRGLGAPHRGVRRDPNVPRARAGRHQRHRHDRRRRRLRRGVLRGRRRRDHGCGHVRAALVPRRPGLEGLVGRRAAVPRAGLRAHPHRATSVDPDAGRHDVPLPQRPDRGRARRGDARPPAAWTCASAAAAGTARDFLRAGLVDDLHVTIAPILLGRGHPALGRPARPRAHPPGDDRGRRERHHPRHLHRDRTPA